VGLSEGNRCKEHSDYGSITLLLQDATGGLEVFDEHSGGWEAVPGEETRRDEAPRQAPTLILNAGSLLSLATNGAIKATKHRVPGPASIASRTDPAELRRAAAVSRHSLAFFVDPDATLRLELEARSGGEAAQGISVAEYVAWRCGKGDGVAYHPGEETS
jgi:isopenicillin N synthase-like dioxygenase